jgi:hypothetical protein
MKRQRVWPVAEKIVPSRQVEFVVAHQQENGKECQNAQH